MRMLPCSLIGVTLLTGCATQTPPLYSWGTIPDSYLKMVQEPGDASSAAYESSLMTTIDQAKQQNKTVPPGVYCELGYVRFKQGRMEEARQLYDAEMALYPESRVFMERLKDKLQKSRTSSPPT
ncbi:MAG: DUF4810 domain-containing protein [Magnetococcales bacterium]|nr:DUF4810 domain-containing protein [Magnetococcales bacterium]